MCGRALRVVGIQVIQINEGTSIVFMPAQSTERLIGRSPRAYPTNIFGSGRYVVVRPLEELLRQRFCTWPAPHARG